MRSLLLAVVLLLGVATPAAGQPAEYVDLAVTVTFDKAVYEPGDQLTLTVSVINNGTVTAHNVIVRATHNLVSYGWGLGVFDDYYGDGAELWPGQSETVTATIDLPTQLSAFLDVTASGREAEHNPADNHAAVEAQVPGARAALSGVLYGDRDGNGRPDPGEALSGVEVRMYRSSPPSVDRTVRTDADGRFAAADLVIGDYGAQLGLPTGWRLARYTDSNFTLLPGDNELVVRTVRDVPPPLSATVAFDRASYAVGDVMREHVTITNHGPTDLSGITALCTGQGEPNELGSAHWGDLAYLGAGVTVRAGETRSFEFTEVASEAGWEYGYLGLFCLFDIDDEFSSAVTASARAAVPGGRGGAAGVLYLVGGGDGYQDGEGLPNLKLYLVDDAGHVLATARTDAQGRFAFPDVPAGYHEIRLVGPWRFYYHVSEYVRVRAGRTADTNKIPVLAGPAQPDPDAVPPVSTSVSTSDTPPVPQAAPVPANLADTGASIGELSAFGMLLLVGGAALVAVSGRRARPRARFPGR